MITTERLIAAAVHKFGARRGERFIHAGGRGMRVKTPGERTLLLPNGTVVKITTDDSGIATQIEEDEALHAVVRPRPIIIRRR
jgi:hypothetical protein